MTVYLSHRHSTPKLFGRQHVGQQCRFMGGHGDEAVAGTVEPAQDISAIRRVFAVGPAVSLDRAGACRLGLDALLGPRIELDLQFLRVLAPPWTLDRLGRIEGGGKV